MSWGLSINLDTVLLLPKAGTGLIKYDLEKGTSQYRDLEGGQASEPVFVSNPDGIDEDDGWVLSYVYCEQDKSEVLILNSQDIEGEPAAVIELPVQVPAGFHGNWVSTKIKLVVDD